MGVDLGKRERDNRTLGDEERAREHGLTPQGICSSPGGCKPSGRMHQSVSTTPLPGRKKTGDDSGADPGSTSSASSVRHCGLTLSMCMLREWVAEPGQESCCRPQVLFTSLNLFRCHRAFFIYSSVQHMSAGCLACATDCSGHLGLSWNKTDRSLLSGN